MNHEPRNSNVYYGIHCQWKWFINNESALVIWISQFTLSELQKVRVGPSLLLYNDNETGHFWWCSGKGHSTYSRITIVMLLQQCSMSITDTSCPWLCWYCCDVTIGARLQIFSTISSQVNRPLRRPHFQYLTGRLSPSGWRSLVCLDWDHSVRGSKLRSAADHTCFSFLSVFSSESKS